MKNADYIAKPKVVSTDNSINHQQNIHDRAAIGMHWVNDEGIIIWANHTEMDMLGYSPDEYIGHHISEFHADKDVIHDILIRLSRKETLNLYEARLCCKDGSVRNVFINSNVYWEEDKFVHTRCFTLDVTEQKLAEKKAVESENRYQQFIHGLPTAFYTCDANGYIQLYNEAAVQLWGLEPVIGKDQWCGSWKIYKIDGTPLPLDECPMAIALKEGRTVSFDIVIERPDGSRRFVVPHPKPLFDPDGKIIGAINTLIDVTPQMEARKKAEQSEQGFRNLILQAVNPILILKGEDLIMEIANEALLKILGVGKDAIGKPFLEILPEMEDQPFPQLLKDVLRNGVIKYGNEQPAYFIRPNGEKEVFYFNYTYTPYRESSGDISGVLVQAYDVTTQVLTRKKIEEQEEQFRTLADNIQNLAWIAEGDGYIFWYNRRWYEYTGTTPDEMNGWGWQSVHDPEKLPLVLEKWKNSIDTGQPFEMVFPIRGANNNFRSFLTRVFPVRDHEGNVIRWIGTNTDIEEQKLFTDKLEMSMKESELRMNTILQYAPDAVITIDQDGRIMSWNPQSEIVFGWKEEEVIGKALSETIIPERYRKQHVTGMKNFLKTGYGPVINKPIDIFALKKDGTEFPVELKISTSIMNGNYLFIGFIRDISFRKQAEEELKYQNEQLEKMNRELQSFAYVSSHDLQEPLRKIQTFATRILEKEYSNLSENGKKYFDRMSEAAGRMQTLIEDLLNYSRTGTDKYEFEIVNLAEVVQEVKNELKEELQQKKATIKISEMCDAAIIPFQFRQLVHNIISNSLKFSKPGISPYIKIKSEIINGTNVNNEKLLPHKNYCHIQFSDNGIGFDPIYSEKIFEVFQRLHGKDEYKGTGIGLAIVKKIVENHNGLITASSKLGEGAQFDIYIPVN